MSEHLQRGMLLYQQGRYHEAVGELRLELANAAEDAWTHGLLALSLNELEQHADATEHAQRAIHLAPDEAFGQYALAHVMMSRHRYDEARAAILEAIRLNAYEADYFGILANLELLKSRWAEALAAANQGLEIEPEHGLCTNMRAQALVKLGDRQAAAETMAEALARTPDNAYTHANQGWALLHEGQPRKALDHFQEALRLDPELEWARAGIVEALQARNFIYRWMLAWFLWMSRLTPRTRWIIVIVAYFGSRFVRQAAATAPQLAPLLWPLLYAYYAFALLTWLAPSFFNLVLRLDRFGRHALSTDQIRGANVLALCLVPTLGLLIASIVTGSGFLFYCTLMMALVALPASTIFRCQPGWPRYTDAAMTLALAAAVLFVLGVGLMESAMHPLLVYQALQLMLVLPWALLASQFAANYLIGVQPQK